MWLPKLFPLTGRHLRVQSRPQSPARRRSTNRLSLESLEDRCVPTATLGSALSIGSTGYDAAFDVATDKTGNVYMTGYFSGNVDFDPANVHAGNTDILTSGGDRDIFVTKYDPKGALVWASQMTGAGTGAIGIGRSIALDGAGNVYLDGYFGGQIAFGTNTLTSTGSRDGFAAKLDAGGNVKWATRWSNGVNDYPQGVAVDGGGNVFAAEYSGTFAAVRKLSPTGAQLWVDQIGPGTGSALAFGVATDATGNAYVCGSFTGNVDFNPGSATYTVNGGAASENGYVLKLTPAGAFGWVSPFIGQTSHSTTGASRCNDLALDSIGNIVVGGWYSGQVDFKSGAGTYLLPSTTNFAGFVTKLSSTGSLVWASQVSSNTDVLSLTLDATGSVYVTGTVQVLTNGAFSNLDVFAAKLNSSGNLVWAYSFGGTGNDYGNGIAVDGSGNVYVVGYYSNTVNFNPDPSGAPDYLTSAGSIDIFFLKLKQS